MKYIALFMLHIRALRARLLILGGVALVFIGAFVVVGSFGTGSSVTALASVTNPLVSASPFVSGEV